MIKRQYRPGPGSYFSNFVVHNMATDPEASIEEALKPYNATVAKSKNKNYRLNVKWHDSKLYMIFVLRWS